VAKSSSPVLLLAAFCLTASAEATDLSKWVPLKGNPGVLVYAKALFRAKAANGEPTVRAFAMWNLIPANGAVSDDRPSVRVEYVVYCKTRRSQSKMVMFELPNLQGKIASEAAEYTALSSVVPQSIDEGIAETYCR
jgi:hypothetical protein